MHLRLNLYYYYYKYYYLLLLILIPIQSTTTTQVLYTQLRHFVQQQLADAIEAGESDMNAWR